MTFAFEKLDVYQKAVSFADRICQATEAFSRGYGFLSDQLNRATLSIAANIAEGNGRFTTPDRKNFFGIARGSVQECVPLLELARRRSLLTDSQHSTLKEDLEEIARMLSGLIKGLEQCKKRSDIRSHLRSDLAWQRLPMVILMVDRQEVIKGQRPRTLAVLRCIAMWGKTSTWRCLSQCLSPRRTRDVLWSRFRIPFCRDWAKSLDRLSISVRLG